MELKQKVTLGTFIGGVVLLIIACIIGWAVLPSVIDDKILESTRLDKGTDQWDRFTNLPVPLLFKVFVFNVKNSLAIMNGNPPELEELGPFVYEQEKYKVHVERDGDHILYRQRQNVTFNKDLSISDELTTKITIPNIPLMTTIQMMEHLPLDLEMTTDEYNAVFMKMFNGINHFLTVTVNELLFKGIDICIPEKIEGDLKAKLFCLLVRLMNLKNIEYLPDKSMKFSFLKFKQTQDDGLWKVDGGFSDIQKLGEAVEWNGGPYMTFWNEEKSECNRVDGRDSTIYPPMMEEGMSLLIFQTDVCRKFPFNHVGSSEFKGIDAFKFTSPLTMFTEEDPENSCYCIKQTLDEEGSENCYMNGLMDLKTCFGVPLVGSLPHFLNADEKYLKMVSGVAPDVDKHQSYADIEPNTGSPLRGAKRIQFNLVTRPVGNEVDGYFAYTEKMARSVLPLIWIEEGVELTDELIEELNELYFNQVALADGVKWGLLGVSIAIIVIALAYFIYLKKKN